MAANITYRCLNCGGDLAWNATKQNWSCEYCESVFTLDQLEQAGKATVDEQTVEKAKEVLDETVHATDGTSGDMVAYTCNHCGAQVVTDKTTSATFCVYCGNPVVISEKLIGVFQPEKVIPFKTTKEQAKAALKAFAKKPLTPRAFYNHTNIEKLTGVYIPFWLYDVTGSDDLLATGSHSTTWEDRRHRYTKTDVYQFARQGSLRFSLVPVDASSKTDDRAMDSIEPFDYKELVDFSPAYLAGFLAERYDIGDEEANTRVEQRVITSTDDALLGTINGVTAVSVTQSNANMTVNKRSYVLLPVWLLNTHYRGKTYLFAMNGQSGRLIGNLPISVAKTAAIGLATFLTTFLGATGLLTLLR